VFLDVVLQSLLDYFIAKYDIEKRTNHKNNPQIESERDFVFHRCRKRIRIAGCVQHFSRLKFCLQWLS